MLDSIAMMLIAVGENFKKIDNETEGSLLKDYPNINWTGVKGIRDVLSHQYFNILNSRSDVTISNKKS